MYAILEASQLTFFLDLAPSCGYLPNYGITALTLPKPPKEGLATL